MSFLCGAPQNKTHVFFLWRATEKIHVCFSVARHRTNKCFFCGAPQNKYMFFLWRATEKIHIGVRGSPERGYFVPACVGSGRWADFERCSRIHACGLRCLGGKTLKTLSKSILLARKPLKTYSFLIKNTPMARN